MFFVYIWNVLCSEEFPTNHCKQRVTLHMIPCVCTGEYYIVLSIHLVGYRMCCLDLCRRMRCVTIWLVHPGSYCIRLNNALESPCNLSSIWNCIRRLQKCWLNKKIRRYYIFTLFFFILRHRPSSVYYNCFQYVQNPWTLQYMFISKWMGLGFILYMNRSRDLSICSMKRLLTIVPVVMFWKDARLSGLYRFWPPGVSTYSRHWVLYLHITLMHAIDIKV